MAGDLVYFVIPTADAARTNEFFGTLLGWEIGQGNVEGGYQILNTTPPGGIFEGDGPGSLDVYFEVDDLPAALEAIRRLGGSHEDVTESESGSYARCRDDQGTEFNLWAAAAASR